MRTHSLLALALLLAAPALGQEQRQQQTPVVRTGTVEIDFGVARFTKLRRNTRVEVAWRPGLNALQALQAAACVTLTEADPTHAAAIDAIDGVKTDLAKHRFWLLDVNGKHAMQQAHEIALEPGFHVRLSYRVPPVVVLIDFGPAERAKRAVEVKWRKGMTALSALQRAAKVKLTDVDPTHPAAVDSVDGVKTDLPRSRFWMFDVNGQHPAVMPGQFPVMPGYEVVWTYTEWKADPSHGDPVPQQGVQTGLTQALPAAE